MPSLIHCYIPTEEEEYIYQSGEVQLGRKCIFLSPESLISNSTAKSEPGASASLLNAWFLLWRLLSVRVLLATMLFSHWIARFANFQCRKHQVPDKSQGKCKAS